MAIDGRSYSTFKVRGGTTLKIEYRDYAPSVTALAKEYAMHGYPERYAVFTEHQSDTSITGTKLREGALEEGIFISLVLRPTLLPAQASALGYLSVVAMTQALETYTSKKLGISWVSDIYCDGIKIGGTQVEGKLKDANSYDYIIVSFAVKTNETIFPPRLKDSVKKVFEKEKLSVGMMMARSILDRFFQLYVNIQDVENQKKYYADKFILKNEKIKYIENGKKRTVSVVDIDKENLSLIVKQPFVGEFNVFTPSRAIIPGRLKNNKQYKKQED
jgi:BirA family biotin operon repressor/biotin-[acetyl-CoA-carboxylase] ligase